MNKIGSAWKSYDKRDRAFYHGEINCPNCSRAFNWMMFQAKERKTEKSPHAYFFEADDRKGSGSRDDSRSSGGRGYNDNRDQGRDDRPRDDRDYDRDRQRDERDRQDRQADTERAYHDRDRGRDDRGRDERPKGPYNQGRDERGEPRSGDEPRDYSRGGGRDKSVFDD